MGDLKLAPCVLTFEKKNRKRVFIRNVETFSNVLKMFIDIQFSKFLDIKKLKQIIWEELLQEDLSNLNENGEKKSKAEHGKEKSEAELKSELTKLKHEIEHVALRERMERRKLHEQLEKERQKHDEELEKKLVKQRQRHDEEWEKKLVKQKQRQDEQLKKERQRYDEQLEKERQRHDEELEKKLVKQRQMHDEELEKKLVKQRQRQDEQLKKERQRHDEQSVRLRELEAYVKGTLSKQVTAATQLREQISLAGESDEAVGFVPDHRNIHMTHPGGIEIRMRLPRVTETECRAVSNHTYETTQHCLRQRQPAVVTNRICQEVKRHCSKQKQQETPFTMQRGQGTVSHSPKQSHRDALPYRQRICSKQDQRNALLTNQRHFKAMLPCLNQNCPISQTCREASAHSPKEKYGNEKCICQDQYVARHSSLQNHWDPQLISQSEGAALCFPSQDQPIADFANHRHFEPHPHGSKENKQDEVLICDEEENPHCFTENQKDAKVGKKGNQTAVRPANFQTQPQCPITNVMHSAFRAKQHQATQYDIMPNPYEQTATNSQMRDHTQQFPQPDEQSGMGHHQCVLYQAHQSQMFMLVMAQIAQIETSHQRQQQQYQQQVQQQNQLFAALLMFLNMQQVQTARTENERQQQHQEQQHQQNQFTVTLLQYLRTQQHQQPQQQQHTTHKASEFSKWVMHTRYENLDDLPHPVEEHKPGKCFAII